jgi:hypothetical protein
MPDMSYRIGGLKINKDKLVFSGPYPYMASHKHVVLSQGATASIYVAEGNSHRDVASEFDLDETRLVGGGSLYLDDDKMLVLKDYSVRYGTIPQEAAERLGGLILAELEKDGIMARGVWADPACVNSGSRDKYQYWKDMGFE